MCLCVCSQGHFRLGQALAQEKLPGKALAAFKQAWGKASQENSKSEILQEMIKTALKMSGTVEVYVLPRVDSIGLAHIIIIPPMPVLQHLTVLNLNGNMTAKAK